MEGRDPDRWRRRAHAPRIGTVLADEGSVADGQGREFRFGPEHTAFSMFVVRRGGRVFGYLNVCPHFSLPLNFRPDQFLNSDGDRIMCTQHFALFRIDDGYCDDGACVGHFLDPVPVRVVDGRLEIG